MSYLDWHVGMKVVCVKGGRHRYHEDTIALVEGKIYTLAELLINPATGNLNVRLVEVRNTERDCAEGFGEPRYGAISFRPVQKRATSIEVFRALLNPTKQDREDIELEDFVLQHSTPMQDEPFR